MSFSTITNWGTGALLLATIVTSGGISPMARAQDADLVAPHSEPGLIGAVEIGQTAEGSLAGLGEEAASSYHTYTVEVPEGTAQLVVEMTADDDLDLGIKQGEAISQYGPEADWDLGDDSLEPSATLTLKDPEAGTWYIDVINSLYTTDPIPYTLEIQ